MSVPRELPPPVPQRVVVAGSPGSALDTFLRRAAECLDVPLVPLAELSGAEDVARLAAFDGWVTTAEYDAARAPLLERADTLVHLDLPVATTLTGLVRRTLRRVRSDATPASDLSWIATAAAQHDGLRVVRLGSPEDVEAWLRSVGG